MGLKMQGKNGLFTPPTYSHIYKLSTVQMSNDKGTWFGWDVSKVGPVEDRQRLDHLGRADEALLDGCFGYPPMKTPKSVADVKDDSIVPSCG